MPYYPSFYGDGREEERREVSGGVGMKGTSRGTNRGTRERERERGWGRRGEENEEVRETGRRMEREGKENWREVDEGTGEESEK